jgi:flagellar basal-body rod protein FlgF
VNRAGTAPEPEWHGGCVWPRMDINSNVATSRLAAQERAIDVIANNIANMNTPGFKAERMQFSDWLEGQRDGSSIAYTEDRATWHELSPGPLQQTGNPLDLAITGDGYFTVSTSAGPRLTRDGRFEVMPDGTIANSAGQGLMDMSGRPIRISPTDTELTVTGDGTLSSQNGVLATIGVVTPNNPMQLIAEGGTLLRSDSNTRKVAKRQVVQGAIEESNVQPVAEMTRLIQGERTFQFLTQYVQAESDRANNAISKIVPQS